MSAGGEGGAERKGVEGDAAGLLESAVPGFQHRADGRARVAGRGLDEDVFESGAGFERGHEQGVQAEAAGQAEIAALAGHADGGILHRMLDAGGHVGLQAFGNRFAVLQAEALVKARAEAAVADALAAEIGTVEARAGIGEAEDVQEEAAETIVAGAGEPLDFVLVGAGVEAQELGDAAVEIAERIGEVLLLLDGQARAAGVPARAAAEIAAAVEGQHGGLLERRNVIGRGSVGQVMLDDAGCGCWGTGPAA